MAKGGKREGAGRPTGSLNKSTIEKKEVEKQLTERILRSVDRLFNAQLALAEGATYLYKIVETGSGKEKRREHVLVTDPEEIKQYLDELEGGSGTMDETYYYLTTKSPDNKAIDSMLDRVFGKAVSKTEVTGKDGKDLFPIPILSNMNVPTHNGNQENSQSSEADSSGTGRNISQ